MPFCPFCGSETSEEDEFCRSCGAVLGSNPDTVPPRKKDRTKIIAVALVLIILVSAMTGIAVILTKDVLTGDLERTYTWDYEGQRCTYKLTIERSYYNKMMDSNIDRSGTVSSDRYTKSDGSTTYAVSDFIVVDKYIQKVADDLAALYKQKFGDGMTNDDYVKFVSAFVQICISYDYDEADSGKEYWRYPLETLYEKIGDCEDTSILLASLIDAHGLKGGIVLAPSHAMCAIAKSELIGSYENQQHSPINYTGSASGVDYYLIETTYDTAETIGDIATVYTAAYLHLYMGNATGYVTS